MLSLKYTFRPRSFNFFFSWFNELKTIELGNPIENDIILKKFQSFINKIEKYVQLIYFSAPNIMFEHHTSIDLAKRLEFNLPLNTLNLPYKVKVFFLKKIRNYKR